MSELKRAFLRAVKAVFDDGIPAFVGRDDGGGSYTIPAPGGNNKVYVRVQQGEAITISTAVNLHELVLTDNLAVRLVFEEGQQVIAKKRYTG